MKKSVITLLAVAALGVAAPVFANDVVKTTNVDPVVKSEVLAKVAAAEEAAAKKAAEEAAAAAADKALVEATVATQPNLDVQPLGNGVYVSAPAKENQNVIVTEAVDKTVANAPAEMKKEEAKKEEAAKPASKTVAAAATKTAAKALPKTSAVK